MVDWGEVTAGGVERLSQALVKVYILFKHSKLVVKSLREAKANTVADVW